MTLATVEMLVSQVAISEIRGGGHASQQRVQLRFHTDEEIASVDVGYIVLKAGSLSYQ